MRALVFAVCFGMAAGIEGPGSLVLIVMPLFFLSFLPWLFRINKEIARRQIP